MEPREHYGRCNLCDTPRTRLFRVPDDWSTSPYLCLPCFRDQIVAHEEFEPGSFEARLFDRLGEILDIFRTVVRANTKDGA